MTINHNIITYISNCYIYVIEKSMCRSKKYLLLFFFIVGFICNSFGSIPESSRSILAIKKTKPVLKKLLRKQNLTLGNPVFIRVFKDSKNLEVWMLNKDKKYSLFKTYNIYACSGTLGPKIKEGDLQAPEGFYKVYPSQLNPLSRFFLSFNIGFPNLYDKTHNRSGSHIMVHGNTVSIGCFAISDPGIKEVYTLIDSAFRNGQKFFHIHIFPFKMNNKNMKIYKDNKWIMFWENLKEGYNFFEKYKYLPKIGISNKKKYTFIGL